MQYSTSHQKPPIYSHNETSKLSTDLSKPSPRSMYSSATQGKKIDESRNISIGAAESEQIREKAKYPIKIPVEQMKVQKAQPIRNRPASAKAQKKTTDENLEKSSNMSSRKRKNSLSKREHTNEDFQTTESNRERMARPKSAKPQKSAVRPLSSRGPKKGVENKRRQNISIDQGKGDEERISKLSEVYQQELRDYDESRKHFAERARQLMMENLMKYQEEMRKHEEMMKHKKEEKELKKTKEAEKTKEVHERAQKNQTELRASRTRKSDRVSENKVVEPKQERKEQSRKVEKEEPLRGLAKKKEEMAIAYGMEEYHTGKRRKQKIPNEWDEESNDKKEKYNIKKTEKAPEEKEKLKKLVQEQFEKKKKEQMDQKALAKQEKEKKKQRLDALMRSVEEMQHKEGGGKHLGHTIKNKGDLSETVKPKRRPFQPIDENIYSQQMGEEIDDSDRYQTREHEEVEEHDDEVEEHEENYENEEEEEENQEMEEFERLEHEVVGEDHEEEREEKEEDYENMDSVEKEAQIYSLDPLKEITNSNNNTSQKKKFSEERRRENEYVEKSKADKKLDFEIEDEGDKENVNKQNYQLRRTEEKQKENKKYPVSVKKEEDEIEESEQKEGEELDFDDMLFTMSSEQLMKLPYFSLAK